jgi:hypothetical protein
MAGNSGDLEPGGNTQTTKDATNPFDPSRVRLPQNFAKTVGVKKAPINVPVRKPNKQELVRVHPSDDYRLETVVLELKAERETYLVAPELWPELPGELTPKVLFTTINRQGVLALWSVRMPGDGGRQNVDPEPWSTSNEQRGLPIVRAPGCPSSRHYVTVR